MKKVQRTKAHLLRALPNLERERFVKGQRGRKDGSSQRLLRMREREGMEGCVLTDDRYWKKAGRRSEKISPHL